MKVVLLAGGYGTRISEESIVKPKPMIEIGGMPILWHIMKYYASFGHNEFIICAGYKQEYIKQWFTNFFMLEEDICFDPSTEQMVMKYRKNADNWKVTVADTGLNTLTGGRLKRIKKYINNDTFLMTYGDGLSDVNLNAVIEQHRVGGKLATLTATVPEGRFGVMDLEGNFVKSFREKSKEDMGWINGGFMVLEPKVLDYIEGDNISFEREPLENISSDGQLMCYRHNGFWQCMDTLKDKQKLEEMWESGNAPWKKW